MTDTAGNVYHPAVATFRGQRSEPGDLLRGEHRRRRPRRNQVTVTFDQPAAFVDLRITEYSGLRASCALRRRRLGDRRRQTPPSTGTLTTAGAVGAAVRRRHDRADLHRAGSGVHGRVITTPDGDLVEDAPAASAGSYGATASLGSGTWLLQLAAFAPAGAP